MLLYIIKESKIYFNPVLYKMLFKFILYRIFFFYNYFYSLEYIVVGIKILILISVHSLSNKKIVFLYFIGYN
jgi:hypothetical protein